MCNRCCYNCCCAYITIAIAGALVRSVNPVLFAIAVYVQSLLFFRYSAFNLAKHDLFSHVGLTMAWFCLGAVMCDVILRTCVASKVEQVDAC